MPEGASFRSQDGTHRREVRLARWKPGQTFRAAALQMPGLDLDRILDMPLSEVALPVISEGGPMLFGTSNRRG